MSSGRDGADERFAAAWDERVRSRATGRPAQTTPPSGDLARGGNDSGVPGRNRAVDTDLADDLRIADLLRDVAAATPGPDAATSARMRASVMAAITEQAPPSGDAPTRTVAATDAPARPGHGRRRADRRGATRPADRRPSSAAGSTGPSRSALRRLMSTTVAGVACILALGALTVLISRGSLPGDMLYGLKRASESAEIGLTSGQEAKGQKHLDLAALRLGEIQEMIQRDTATAAGPRPTAAGLDDTDAALVADNLRAFDQQARTGSKLLLGLVQQPSGPSAGTLARWATEQQRFDQVAPSLSPEGREQAASSQRLLTQLQSRAAAFESDPTCSSGSSDDLGPLPSESCGTAPTAAPSTTAAPETSSSTPSSTTRTTSSTEPTTTTSGTDSTRSTSSPTGSTPSTTDTPAPVQVPVPVPGLPKVELPPLLPGLPGLTLG